MDDGMDEVAAGVGKDMALPPLDLLAGIIATNTAALGGLHTLAVDHTGARAFSDQYAS